jgi:histidinol dehydrogenase
MSTAVMVRRLSSEHAEFARVWQHLCDRGVDANSEVEVAVARIVDEVRERGDDAVREYTERFDRRSPGLRGYEIAEERWQEAVEQTDEDVLSALRASAERIRRFHEPQRPRSYELDEGRLALRATALERVGIYVPGGTALYPSSVLMTAIPAHVAGVEEIIMVTPGASRETLAAASIGGVDRVFEVGGAQAVAALAFGTETIPRVDKIVGPGNQWVAAAKRQVFGQVDIDSVAGPSEVLIVADASATGDWIAADLLAQAEHDRQARALLLSDDAQLLDEVERSLARRLEELPRQEIARASLSLHGALVKVRDLDEAVSLANEYASEHLELALADPAPVIDRIRHAGAIFAGHYTPEAAGDYSAGPNHVLPTGAAARFASPLGVYDFIKYTTVLALDAEHLGVLRGPIETLARIEGLAAHGASVAARFDRDEEG